MEPISRYNVSPSEKKSTIWIVESTFREMQIFLKDDWQFIVNAMNVDSAG